MPDGTDEEQHPDKEWSDEDYAELLRRTREEGRKNRQRREDGEPEPERAADDPRPRRRRGGRLNRKERELHLAMVARLMLQEYQQSEIAEKLGVVQSQIAYDQKVLRKRWAQQAVVDYEGVVAVQLAKLQLMEKEAWDAWERSKEEQRIVQQERTNLPTTIGRDGSEIVGGMRQKNAIRVVRKPGDVQFLAIILKIQERTANLQGTDANERIDVLIRRKAEEIAAREGIPVQDIMDSFYAIRRGQS